MTPPRYPAPVYAVRHQHAARWIILGAALVWLSGLVIGVAW